MTETAGEYEPVSDDYYYLATLVLFVTYWAMLALVYFRGLSSLFAPSFGIYALTIVALWLDLRNFPYQVQEYSTAGWVLGATLVYPLVVPWYLVARMAALREEESDG